ncbi:hypothetical protein WJX74_008575 [Apatococcus lobatus]|uniref:Thioredoxin domain-containing protein n=2 Tax=Apatococcus TaxID=904362 RepID=A0AAW1SWL4_9CHLO
MAVGCVAGCPSRSFRSRSTFRPKTLSSVSRIAPRSQLQARPCKAQAHRARNCLERTCAVLNVDQSSFEAEVVKADKPVLLDFWAAWCGPCKLISPFMDKLEQEYGAALKVVKIEADGNPDLVEKYKVYGLPTVMLFRDGKKVDASHNEGAITLPKLKQYLEKHGIAAAAAAAS